MLSGVTTDITAAHVMASGDLGQQLVVKSGSMCFGHANGTSPQDAAGVYPAVRPQPNDVALFLHTSGTTSKPKGVPLTHANLCASLANIIKTYELSPQDRSYLVMPLFHVHGLMAGLLAPLAAGSAVILPAGGKFSAQVFWKDCCEHQATFYTAVPTIHQILLSRAAQDYPAQSPPPLRFIRSCSSSLAAPTLHKLEATFGVPVLEAYAMTEAAHQMTSNPLPKHGIRKPGSVGQPQGSVQVAILNGHNIPLPPGVIGEVCIRGPNVTAGYLNNPKANEQAYAGGWFHTGDQGWLDEAGYVTLTGRLKELINRGGEKISPLEIDSVLLGHPDVAEAVCFGAPDEKYGEVVAAVVVLRQGAPQDVADDIRAYCKTRLAAFKVPQQIFITDVLPKGPTGKIQRRFMADAFIKAKPNSSSGSGNSKAAGVSRNPAAALELSPSPCTSPSQGSSNSSSQGCDHGISRVPASSTAGPPGGGAEGHAIVAQALAHAGVRFMFGVVGIPVTSLASSAQAAGIRYIGMRNEQAAGYAAAAAGYLTGVPAVLLTVSGPGAIHGIAGLSHAQINGWPLIMVSGSADQSEVGKGSFQECDQVSAVQQFCKYAGQALSPTDIPDVVAAAYKAAVAGRPGGAYVDVPSNVLMAKVQDAGSAARQGSSMSGALQPAASVDAQAVAAAVALLRSAQRPLVVVGEGAAYSGAEQQVQVLANRYGLPVLCTSMGRGLLPDDHGSCVNAARSLAIGGADVALVVGARLNWQLHFGEPPKWSPGVKFIMTDVELGARDAGKAQVTLVGDVQEVLQQLLTQLSQPPGLQPSQYSQWLQQLQAKVSAAGQSLTRKLAPTQYPLDYYTSLRVMKEVLVSVTPEPIIVSEGANTMDNARVILPCSSPRTRLDAGTWGTMGVGLGYAVAAAVACPDRLVLAVEGDSAFGFSGMECETIVRYGLPVVIVVFNNNGIYGGDRRAKELAAAATAGATAHGFASDPSPTDFVPNARYQMVMEAFGGRGYQVDTAEQLRVVCVEAFNSRRPALVNITIDPMAGVESGNVHAFNAPKSKL
eukprot:jgi/Chrzof1/3196/Cz12g15140.t1